MSRPLTPSRSLSAPRISIGIALLLTIAIGIASRKFATPLPSVVQKEAGNVLWAMAAYWAIALVCPGWRPRWVAVLATY
jgi:hypothetical protein